MSLKVGSLVIGQQTRRQRRQGAKAERKRFQEISNQRRELKRKEKEAEADLWEGQSLPEEGEAGDRMGRSVIPAYASLTRISTKKAAVQYPFLAAECLGGDGPLIGYDKLTYRAFCFDPYGEYAKGNLSNINMAIIGSIGTGKSSLMKCMALRDLVFGRRTFVPGDPKGEWTGVVRAVGGAAITIGGTSQDRLNPLDAGRRPERDKEGKVVSDDRWHDMVENQRLTLMSALISTLMDRALNQAEQAALSVALSAAVRRQETPLITTVVDELFEPTSSVKALQGFRDDEDLKNVGREIGFALQRLTIGSLKGLFDGPSTVRFDPQSPMMSINLENFAQESDEIALVMACTSSWFEASLRGDDLGQRNVIYEEAHELMRFPELLSRMRSNFKLGRRWKLRNVIALHRVSDLDAVGSLGSKQRAVAEGLLSDTSTRVVYRQETDQLENTQRVLGLSDASLAAIESVSIGSGLWQVGKRPYLVAHHRTEWEKVMTNTDSGIGERK